MYAVIRFIKGENQGHEVKVHPGAKIGRRNADIIINDRKVSSEHAQFLIEKDDFILADLGSRNGINIDGNKVKKVSLIKGLIVGIGDTSFIVEDIFRHEDGQEVMLEPDAESKTVELLPDDIPIPQITPDSIISEEPSISVDISPPVNPAEQTDWTNYFEEFSENASSNIRNLDLPIMPFKIPIELKVIKGPQFDETFLLGYGPRSAGTCSFDIQLVDPYCPKQAFILYPTKAGVLFKTKIPDKVFINGQSLESELLKDGDVIEIGSTELSVRFLNDIR